MALYGSRSRCRLHFSSVDLTVRGFSYPAVGLSDILSAGVINNLEYHVTTGPVSCLLSLVATSATSLFALPSLRFLSQHSICSCSPLRCQSRPLLSTSPSTPDNSKTLGRFQYSEHTFRRGLNNWSQVDVSIGHNVLPKTTTRRFNIGPSAFIYFLTGHYQSFPGNLACPLPLLLLTPLGSVTPSAHGALNFRLASSTILRRLIPIVQDSSMRPYYALYLDLRCSVLSLLLLVV